MSVTKKKRLRVGESVWHSVSAPSVPQLSPGAKVKCDVLVVGAGISGALISELLSSKKLSVAIVDRRGAGLGSTPASTALLQYEIDMPLIELRKKIGEVNAMRAWRRSRLGLDGIAYRTAELGIRCDAVRRKSLYLAGNKLGPSELCEESQMRRLAGFETAYLSSKELQERFGLNRRAALLSYGNLAVNPRRMTAGYLNVALARGARLYTPIEITEMDADRGGIRALSNSGTIFEASAAIYATGYEVPKAVRLRSLSIMSTWAMATLRQKRNLWPSEAFIWESSDPYLYLRTTPDGRIICGGEDEQFSDEEKRDAKLSKKVRRLQQKLSKLMPWVNTTAEYEWCASFGSSETGLPRIGLIPGYQNLYAALGYGGNGITFSRVAAELLTARILGEKDPDADIFRI